MDYWGLLECQKPDWGLHSECPSSRKELPGLSCVCYVHQFLISYFNPYEELLFQRFSILFYFIRFIYYICVLTFLWLSIMNWFSCLKSPEPLQVDCSHLTSKSPGVPGTHLIDLRRMKGGTNLGFDSSALATKSFPYEVHCWLEKKLQKICKIQDNF